VHVEVREGETLLETLRTRCGVMSIKDGCQPQGQCGCCLARHLCRHGTGHLGVAVDQHGIDDFRVAGSAAEVAIDRARDLRARRRGIPADEMMCTKGDARDAEAALHSRRGDERDLFARARRGEALPDLIDGGVGVRAARFRGADLILGRKEFVDDLVRPGMLHGAVVLSPHARALVVSIDTRKARAHPGVVAVATADDVPGKRHYGLLRDDWPGFVAAGEEVSYVGDIVAAIAAVDEATAGEAAALVDVAYEPLPPILDPENAERIFSRTHIKRGDVDAPLAASAHVVRGRWRTQRIEHLFLEPESAMAEPLEGGRLRLFSSGQGIFDDRRQVAAFLGMPEEDLLVEQLSSGGAFGGKEDLSIQAHAALLTFMTKRPVKLTLNREESIRIHPKRHPMRLAYTAGCDAEGHLTAVRARILGYSQWPELKRSRPPTI